MRRALGLGGGALLVSAGLLAAFLVMAGAASSKAKPAPHAARKAKATVVKVTAKEWAFVLSKRTVPVGTVLFKVTNKGKIGHDFVIAKKKTKLLKPGQSQTIKVVFKKKGRYAYDCSVPGHAGLGMKGKLAVGVKPAAPTPPPPATTTTTPTTTTTATTPTATVGSASTTVTVSMFEYGYTLSQTSVPSGQVTFVIKNTGQEVHNFDLETIHAGALLDPGASETWTVSLAPRTYTYECDVAYHAQEGMIGQLTVTP